MTSICCLYKLYIACWNYLNNTSCVQHALFNYMYGPSLPRSLPKTINIIASLRLATIFSVEMRNSLTVIL